MQLIFSLLLLIALPTLLRAQSIESAIFGGIGIGLVAHDNEPFSNRLGSWSPPGEENRVRVYRTPPVSNTGFTLNAGGALLIDSRYVLGLSGEMLFFPSFEAITTTEDRAIYNLGAVGGGLDFGYAVINDDATLLWPYISLGYYSYSLSFENKSGEPTPFFESEPVPAGGTETYSGGAFRPGIGLALTRFIGGANEAEDPSGFILMARLGWGFFPSHPNWQIDGNDVANGGRTPCYSGVGLSVSIGAGSGSLVQ